MDYSAQGPKLTVRYSHKDNTVSFGPTGQPAAGTLTLTEASELANLLPGIIRRALTNPSPDTEPHPFTLA